MTQTEIIILNFEKTRRQSANFWQKSTPFFLIIAFLFLTNQAYAQHRLAKVWETDTLLEVPESVLYSKKNKVLYVSNIGGTKPWEKDGNGSIGKIGLDGKIIKVDWITGLNAPKGLGLFGDKLYVADITEVVVIDIVKEKIVQKIPVDSAERLNDITIDRKGIVYVSDSRTNKIHQIVGDKATVLIEKLGFPNGLFMYKNRLHLLDDGGLYRMEKDKKLSLISKGMEGTTDGLESVGKNAFLVSCWEGAIWYVSANGNKEVLLDTRNQKINTADIGYDAKNKMVFVPTFWKNKVVAYELQSK